MKHRSVYASQNLPGRNPQFDRQWTEPEGLKPIGPVAAKVAEDLAFRAVEHWLGLAEHLTGDEQQVAVTTAQEIAETAGLDFAEIVDREKAA